MNRSEIIETARALGLSPNKKLGQNFLCDTGTVGKILGAAGVAVTDTVLEIGPGLGALTGGLLERAGSVTAVEIDAGFVRYLSDRFSGNGKLRLIHGDFIKIAPSGVFTKAVSNLPYYCSSEVLFKLATEYRIPSVYVMLQKEMAGRIVAAPGTAQYGALSVALGIYYRARSLFGIRPECFYPRPDVVSVFIELAMRDDVGLDEEGLALFHLLVKSAFWGRRKTLSKALADSPHIDLDRKVVLGVLGEMGMDERIRGENMSVAEYTILTARIQEAIRAGN
ncbi:MAG TPA: 16S rRNA (adenine(1518)-N(6)/adenine(1519)-N(6))-dimethyltransferase RsmA [Spirochaetota bacterium]|nr:16S rRNA (adenine(1518)-N(6)/adenine(1519)-N(6))-dimethyltransferase RsmA [Spirochaetota bacterium]